MVSSMAIPSKSIQGDKVNCDKLKNWSMHDTHSGISFSSVCHVAYLKDKVILYIVKSLNDTKNTQSVWFVLKMGEMIGWRNNL